MKYTDEVCALSFCDKTAMGLSPKSKTLVCGTHYNQEWSGREFAPIRVYKDLPQDGNGRTCVTCERYKPWDEFYKRSGPHDGYQSECKTCFRDRATRNRLAREAEAVAANV